MTLGKPVTSIPSKSRKPQPHGGRNQQLVEKFLSSPFDAQRVEYAPMKATTAYQSLIQTVRLNNYPARVIMRGASLYLARKPVTNDTPIVEM